MADVKEVTTALANEETIRAQQFTQLTATDTANADQIATVAENAVAAIGYCTIGGNPATQGDKSSCEAVGGVWTEAPLAEAVRQTQVTSGSDSATVGSHYQSFVGLNNELVGKATVGVNTGGTFTGLSIIGGSNLSSITFQGDTFKIKDTSGTDALYWSSVDDEWKFNGGGTFNGTLSAPTVIGGTFNGGTFTGNEFIGGKIVTDSGTGIRGEYWDDGTYLQWIGSGAKTDANGVFWIKRNGTGFIKGEFFQGEIIETRYGTISNSGQATAVCNMVGHSSAGRTVEISGTFGATQSDTGDFSGDLRTATLSYRRGGIELARQTVNAFGIYTSGLNISRWQFNAAFSFLDTTTVDGQLYDYSVVITLDIGSPTNNVISANSKTFENKLG